MVKSAIEFNPFKTKKFIWVDFGLKHIFNSSAEFIKGLYKDFNFTKGKVKIAGLWDLDQAIKTDPITSINWFFAGGVFGGYAEDLIKFDNLCDKQFKKNADLGIITLEVNTWLQVYLENPHNIEHVLVGNFGPGILLNF